MALTGIDIYLNRDEFSRYETTRSVVKTRIVPVPATGLVSESVVVSLEKMGVPIATQSITFNGAMPKGTVVEFDLNTIKDSDGTTHITRGDYKITAVQGAIEGVKPFKVAMITVDEMRKSYCQGLHLVSGLKKAPKRQPSVVTGVTIASVSKDTKKGVFGLVYDATTKSLSWNGSVPTILAEETTDEILISPKGDYIEVEIDYFALPATNASEGILIDQMDLESAFLQGEIEKATNEIEDSLKVRLEPTRVATEPYYSNPAQGEYFDDRAVPVCYYEKDFNRRGLAWHIDLPYHQLGKVTGLSGYMGNTKALSLGSGAITSNRKSGNVDVLPYNSEYAYFFTFFVGMHIWGVREFIADFWRYKAIIGVQDKNISELLKMVGYTAAMAILTTAEQAYRSGITSESISKDGVSRSQSYNAKGIYDATIQEYKEWLKEGIPKHRNLLRGMPCVVL